MSAVIKRDMPADATPMAMIQYALSQGASTETLAQMMALQERWESYQGRKAFDAALAAAKAEIPVIVKNRTVDFASKGGRTNYRYEDLGEIARTVDPILAKHGLSYRWRTTSAPNEPVTVTCIVSHRDGYSEQNTLTAPRDDSGNKNAIQMIGSTVTFLQRYTLKAALGLAASADDDGRGAEPLAKISAEDAENIRDMLKAKGASEEKFLRWANVERVEDIEDIRYDRCVTAIQAFQAKKEPAP